jgi:hypothetical protein
MHAPSTSRPTTPLLGRLNWWLVTALAAVALVRPVFSAVGLSETLGTPATPLVLTAVISLVWILVVGLSRVREPVLTLGAAGVAYALASIVLSAILSPILTGELQGPLAMPLAVLPVLVVNAAWGAVCGLFAMGLQNLRGLRS